MSTSGKEPIISQKKVAVFSQITTKKILQRRMDTSVVRLIVEVFFSLFSLSFFSFLLYIYSPLPISPFYRIALFE